MPLAQKSDTASAYLTSYLAALTAAVDGVTAEPSTVSRTSGLEKYGFTEKSVMSRPGNSMTFAPRLSS